MRAEQNIDKDGERGRGDGKDGGGRGRWGVR